MVSSSPAFLGVIPLLSMCFISGISTPFFFRQVWSTYLVEFHYTLFVEFTCPFLDQLRHSFFIPIPSLRRVLNALSISLFQVRVYELFPVLWVHRPFAFFMIGYMRTSDIHVCFFCLLNVYFFLLRSRTPVVHCTPYAYTMLHTLLYMRVHLRVLSLSTRSVFCVFRLLRILSSTYPIFCVFSFLPIPLLFFYFPWRRFVFLISFQ